MYGGICLKRIFLSLFFGVLLLQGCSSEQLSPIPKEQAVALTVNTFDSSLSFINVQSQTVMVTWQLDFPVQRATLLDDDHLLLYGKTIPAIYVYELSTGKKVDTWTVEHGIYDIAVSHDKEELYATSSNTNEVLFLTTDGKLLRRISVGEKPQSLIMSDKLLIVLNYGDDSMSIVDLDTKQVKNVWSSPERAVDGAIVQANNELWIGGHGKGTNIEHSISIYDLADGALLKQIYAPVMPVIFENIDDDMLVLSHGSNELRKIDIHSRDIIDVVEIGANPFAIASDKQHLYIAGYDSNDLSIVDAQTFDILSVLPVGEGPIQVLIRER